MAVEVAVAAEDEVVAVEVEAVDEEAAEAVVDEADLAEVSIGR